jgi:uncharacterized protein
MMNTRYIADTLEDIAFGRDKICFVSGPRQVGKTTLAKELLKIRGHGSYWNWDESVFRKQWTKNPNELISEFSVSPHKKKPLIIFDKIHKARFWKRTLKGLYDTLPYPVDMLVTGSARLDAFQKGSDSLMGRYILFHSDCTLCPSANSILQPDHSPRRMF